MLDGKPIVSPAGAIGLMQLMPGTYDELRRAPLYEPFEKATGIKVTTVAMGAGKLVATFKAGQADLDVIETGDDMVPSHDIERSEAGHPVWTIRLDPSDDRE